MTSELNFMQNHQHILCFFFFKEIQSCKFFRDIFYIIFYFHLFPSSTSKGLFSSLQSKVHIFFLLLYFCIDTSFLFFKVVYLVVNNIFYAVLCIIIISYTFSLFNQLTETFVFFCFLFVNN